MCHSDDDGLRVPPKVAPKHVVIVPVIPKDEVQGVVFDACDALARELKTVRFGDELISVHVDKRDMRGGDKAWHWIKKGAPIRIEVGPRDIESKSAMLYRRDKGTKDKEAIAVAELAARIPGILSDIQSNYLAQALAFRDAHLTTDISSYGDFREFFSPKNSEKPEIHGGFVRAKWSEDPESLALLDDLKVTIRCLPRDQSGTSGKCVLTGKDASKDAIFAKTY